MLLFAVIFVVVLHATWQPVAFFVTNVWLTGQMLALFSLNHIASRKHILCSAVTCKLIQQHVASLKLVSTLTTASNLPQL